jgi:predicted acyltransferase
MKAASELHSGAVSSVPLAGRLGSLDVFRGATVAAMLVVNNPGSWGAVYEPLDHAKWNGWTPTDMIFPFFLWIVGVAMALSIQRRKARGEDRGRLFQHVLVRSAAIFAFGILLSAFPFGLMPGHPYSFATQRIPGVLQRIAVCYAAASAICLTSGWRGQLAWAAGLLVGYAALLRGVPVPGFGAGHLEPQGNLAWWIDSHVLAGHTWSGAPVPGFDPEGILSTVPAVGTTLLGALTGYFLQRPDPPRRKAVGLVVVGLGLILVGWLVGLWLPINKNLWTSSYALFMGGWAALILGILFELVDRRGWKKWTLPFEVLGTNAIALFLISGLVARLLNLIAWTDAAGTRVALKTFLYQGIFVPHADPYVASLAFALAFLAFHWAIAWLLWRKSWFFKV